MKAQIETLRLEEPETAEKLKDFVFNSCDIDQEWAKGPIPLDEIKFYPGSQKGPDPEDDPEHYSQWFVKN